MSNFKQYGSHMIKLIFVFIVTAILLLWGWNSAIPDLFGLPAMQFKQATGLIIIVGIMSFFLGAGRHGCREITHPNRNEPVLEK